MLKKTVKIVSLLFIVLVISACSTHRRTDQKVFGFSSMNNSLPFFVTMCDEIRAQVEARGDILIEVDGAQSQEKQLNGIENLIIQNIDGMFLNPVEKVGVEPVLDVLNNAGIPIINCDSQVASMDKIVAFVGTDNKKTGILCAEDLIKRVPEGGDVIILCYKTADSIVSRVEGFTETIEGYGFRIVGEADTLGSQDKAMDATENLLQANPNVVAIFCGNDPSAMGAMSSAEAAGYKVGEKDIIIYGVDGSPEVKNEVARKDSLIQGTAAQSPITIARKAVELMYAYLNGEEIEKEYSVPTVLITEDNVSDYSLDGWQ